jgi:hypothetical protein
MAGVHFAASGALVGALALVTCGSGLVPGGGAEDREGAAHAPCVNGASSAPVCIKDV